MTSQRGTLKRIVTPDYDFGVLADPKQPGLVEIPVTQNWSIIRAKEDFEIFDIGGSARLKVETFYSGREADNVRDGLKTSTKTEINKNYTDFYANEYPEIKLTKSVSYADDTLKNTVIVFEEYDIPNFWKYDSARSKYVAGTYARVISSYINRPATKARHTPFAIRYPLDIQLVTNLHVPEEWSVSTASKTVSGPSFKYNSSYSYADKVVRLEFGLHHTERTVEPDKMIQYLDRVDQVFNDLSFEITHSGNSTALTAENYESKNGKVALLILSLATALYFAGKRLFEFDPRSRQLDERYDRIEGWLLLPALGLTLWPFITLFNLTSNWNNHAAIFSESSFNVHKVILIGNVLLQMLFLTAVSLSAILFWKRRTSTPHFIVATYALNLLIVTLDIALGKMLYDVTMDSSAQTRLFYAIVLPAIWVPAFLLSDRAKGTFTQRLED
jgi:hypothetical protein